MDRERKGENKMKDIDKSVREMLDELFDNNPLEKLAEGLQDIWELQDKLKEIEREVIKGNVASIQMEVNLKVEKVERRKKGEEKDEEDDRTNARA